MNGRRWIQIVAWAEIIGGVAGIALMPFIAVVGDRSGVPGAVRPPSYWYVLALVAFLLSIAAGINLRRNMTRGWWMSLLVQGAQVVRFSTATFTYQYSGGIDVLVHLDPSELRFSPGISTSLSAMALPTREPWSFGINLFSIFAIWLLVWAYGRRREEAVAPAV